MKSGFLKLFEKLFEDSACVKLLDCLLDSPLREDGLSKVELWNYSGLDKKEFFRAFRKLDAFDLILGRRSGRHVIISLNQKSKLGEALLSLDEELLK